ncbi:MAG: helix-turn-helix transcriptional regulator [Slackia sp.]|nr:helix-turn-helix transcriptional regulator [Slackia sp.]
MTGLHFDNRMLRFRVAACAGYALLLYVCQMTLWGGLLLTSRISFGVLDIIEWWSVPLCVALAAACVAVGFFASRPRCFHRSCVVLILTVVSAAFMMSGYPLSVWTGGVNAFVCLGAAVLGVGMGLAFSSWCSVFARMGSVRAMHLVLGSVVAGSVLSLVATLFSLKGLEISFFVAVVLSSILLAYAVRHASCFEGCDTFLCAEQPETMRLSLKSLFESVRVSLLCACAIAFAVAITRMMSLTAAPAMSSAINILGVLAAGFAAAILLVFMRGGKSDGVRLGISSLFQALFPLVATLLLIMSVAGSFVAMLAGAAVFAIHSIMFALVLPACIEGSDKTKAPPTAVYGLFAGAVYALFAFATFLGVALFKGGSGSGASVSFVAVLLVFYVLAMANAFAQRRSKRAVGIFDVDGNLRLLDDSVSGTQTLSSSLGDGLVCASKSGRALEADVEEVDCGFVSSASGTEVECIVEDPIERRCLNVAGSYSLSPRETDVLIAFAHGRNVAYLAERLVLSTNTIRSHSKTLYAKLGVHSKQELIDLVEREG